MVKHSKMYLNDMLCKKMLVYLSDLTLSKFGFIYSGCLSSCSAVFVFTEPPLSQVLSQLKRNRRKRTKKAALISVIIKMMMLIILMTRMGLRIIMMVVIVITCIGETIKVEVE